MRAKPWHQDPLRLLQFRLNRLYIDETIDIPDELGGGIIKRISPEMVELYPQPQKQTALWDEEPDQIKGKAIKLELTQVMTYIRRDNACVARKKEASWQH